MSLLILGGTGDAKMLVNALCESHIVTPDIIYSVAGIVRIPQLPCKVISGGFRQYSTYPTSNRVLSPTGGNTSKHNGLENYIRDNKITAILDATHPYAKNMSESAAFAARQCAIPYWRYLRLPWEEQAEDNWTIFKNWDALIPHLANKSSVFFSSGQVSTEIFDKIDQLLDGKEQTHLLRTAVKPKAILAENVHWIKSIGPFNLDREISLLKKHKVDVIVTKNSGGEATSAKLQAARSLQIPVLMLDRPNLPAADRVFSEINCCKQFLITYFS